MGECLSQSRQSCQGTRHPHLLSSRAQIQSHAPAQPGRTGPEAVVPPTARIELADQIEQARGCRFEMRRELGDLVAQAIEGRVVDGIGCQSFHDESPFADSILHRGFGRAGKALRSDDRGRLRDFSSGHSLLARQRFHVILG